MTESLTCPHCGEEILAVAIKCRYCGVALDKDAVVAERASTRPAKHHPRKVSTFWGLMLGAGGFGTACLALFESEWGLPSWGMTTLILSFLTAIGGLVLLGRDLATPERRKRWPISFCSTLLILGLFLLAIGVTAPHLIRPRGTSNETWAVRSLKNIGTAQSIFREADKEADGNLDYGTLQELASSGTHGLIDSVLGSGTKCGYVFSCTYSASTSEFIWFATASPALPTTTGDRYFATNHEGVIYFTSQKAFRLDSVSCTIPANVRAIGR